MNDRPTSPAAHSAGGGTSPASPPLRVGPEGIVDRESQRPRSAGSRHVARALWYVRPGVVELRPQTLTRLKPGEARVRTHFSAISRGTERLVLAGRVPESEYQRMRAPLQDGIFPFPVKYGYGAAGVVEDGPGDLVGRPVFCLHPHQDVFDAPVAMLVPIPRGIPPRRATLAANMETALNALWDAGAGPGDRIVIVGAGIVGLLVAALAVGLPGAEVSVTDPATDRRPLVEALGAVFFGFDQRDLIPKDADVVVHTSATPAGLQLALATAGFEASVVELSWYGDGLTPVPLGGAFHSRRLRVIASQVGHVPASHRPRWSQRRRLEKALDLLCDLRFDGLVTEQVAFTDLPSTLPTVLADTAALPPVIGYLP